MLVMYNNCTNAEQSIFYYDDDDDDDDDANTQ